MANEYVTLDELKATLELHNAEFDANLDIALESASRCVDGYMGTRFYPTEETRVYTPRRGGRELQIDDLSELAALKVDEDGDGVHETTWVDGTDFVLDPANADLDGYPFNRVVLVEQAGRRFPRYRRSVQIEGEFGWAATPPGVKQATGLLAARLFKRWRETPYAIMSVVGNEAVAAARIGRIDPDVANLLDNLPGVERPSLRSVQLG